MKVPVGLEVDSRKPSVLGGQFTLDKAILYASVILEVLQGVKRVRDNSGASPSAEQTAQAEEVLNESD